MPWQNYLLTVVFKNEITSNHSWITSDCIGERFSFICLSKRICSWLNKRELIFCINCSFSLWLCQKCPLTLLESNLFSKDMIWTTGELNQKGMKNKVSLQNNFLLHLQKQILLRVYLKENSKFHTNSWKRFSSSEESSNPKPYSNPSLLQQVFQSCIHLGFEYIQGQRLYNLSGCYVSPLKPLSCGILPSWSMRRSKSCISVFFPSLEDPQLHHLIVATSKAVLAYP